MYVYVGFLHKVTINFAAQVPTVPIPVHCYSIIKKKLRVFCLFDVCKLATDERKTVKYTTVQYCKLSSSRTPLMINSQKWLEGTVPTYRYNLYCKERTASVLPKTEKKVKNNELV